MEMDRAQNLADKYEAQEYAAEAEQWAAYGNIANSAVSGLSNISGAMATNAATTPPPTGGSGE